MEKKRVAELSLKVILEKKLSFLLDSEVMPFDSSDNRNIGERESPFVILNGRDGPELWH